jgi:hypothetical protein
VEVFVRETVCEHQDRCHYRPQPCPVDKLPAIKCDWTGIYQDIKKHLIEKHPGECHKYVDRDVVYLNKIPVHFCVSRYVLQLNEVFWLSFHGIKHKIFYAALQYIGPSENATNYQYKFKFMNEDNTESVTVKHLTRSFHENLHDVFKSGNCGKLHYDVVSRLATKDEGLTFSVKIFRVGD